MSKTKICINDLVRLSDHRVGVVSFIGPTSFRPGIWYGISLTEGSGRNDGSVGHRTYFECAANTGVFVPRDKIAEIVEVSASSKRWTVGEKCSVDERGNGVIRYIGETQFARGIWYGVSLSMPSGSHNGRVQDVTYFSCRPRNGVFVRGNKLRKHDKSLELPSYLSPRASMSPRSAWDAKITRSKSPTNRRTASASRNKRSKAPIVKRRRSKSRPESIFPPTTSRPVKSKTPEPPVRHVTITGVPKLTNNSSDNSNTLRHGSAPPADYARHGRKRSRSIDITALRQNSKELDLDFEDDDGDDYEESPMTLIPKRATRNRTSPRRNDKKLSRDRAETTPNRPKRGTRMNRAESTQEAAKRRATISQRTRRVKSHKPAQYLQNAIEQQRRVHREEEKRQLSESNPALLHQFSFEEIMILERNDNPNPEQIFDFIRPVGERLEEGTVLAERLDTYSKILVRTVELLHEEHDLAVSMNMTPTSVNMPRLHLFEETESSGGPGHGQLPSFSLDGVSSVTSASVTSGFSSSMPMMVNPGDSASLPLTMSGVVSGKSVASDLTLSLPDSPDLMSRTSSVKSVDDSFRNYDDCGYELPKFETSLSGIYVLRETIDTVEGSEFVVNMLENETIAIRDDERKWPETSEETDFIAHLKPLFDESHISLLEEHGRECCSDLTISHLSLNHVGLFFVKTLENKLLNGRFSGGSDASESATINKYIMNAQASYVVDLNWLTKYSVRKGYERYGANAYFDENGSLIRISRDGQSYRSYNTGWDHAKYAFRSSLILATYMKTYLMDLLLKVGNAITIASQESFPPSHNLLFLFRLFQFRTDSFARLLTQSFLRPNGVLHRCTAFDEEGLAGFIGDCLTSFEWCDWKTKMTDLRSRDEHNLIGHEIFEVSIDVWHTIQNFVTAFIKICFPYEQQLTQDEHVRLFWDAMGRTVLASVDETDRELTVENFTAFMTEYIFRVLVVKQMVNNSRYMCSDANIAGFRIRREQDQASVQSFVQMNALAAMSRLYMPRLRVDLAAAINSKPHRDRTRVVLEQFISNLHALRIDFVHEHRSEPFFDPTLFSCGLTL